MSVWARHWALTQSVGGEGASRAARRCVLNDLADWMIGDDAVECCPTIETIAFDTGFNRQTVMKAIVALIEQGLVTRRFEWEGLKKYAYYRFVGYVPSEWKNTLRPDAKHPEGPRFKTTEKSDVRKAGSTKSCTTEGMKSRTTEGTKSHTHGGTKFRTVPGNKQGITGNEQGRFSPAFACDAPEEGVAHKTGVTPSPDDWASLLSETAPSDDVPTGLFDDMPPEPEPAPKPADKKPKRSRAASDAWPVEGDGIDADTRAAYLAVRKAKRVGPFTAKAYEQIKAQGEKFGRSMAETIGVCIGRGWVYPYDSALQQSNSTNGKNNGIQDDRRGFVLTPQSEYDYEAGLRMFEERRAARRARDA